VPSGQPRS